MYVPRAISPLAGVWETDGVKLYSITASGQPVDPKKYLPELATLKRAQPGVDWSRTAAFAIFHDGSSLDYLVLAWWGNDNELFVRVSVRDQGYWVVEPARYSFCLFDMEIMWYERESYIRHIYSGEMDIFAYRHDRMK